ncbi:MAG: hypothetical protein F6J98_44295 [Moorea sp. SIO4G2]|nr:hypothetical protein [Moorena sp. SIO4G2]
MIKASLSYGNYRLWRRLAVGHAKGEREQTMSNWRGFPHSRFAWLTMMIFSDAAREQGSQCGLGGLPHEQLAWFPPLALCMADNDKLSIFSYPLHPTPHPLHPTPHVFVKNLPL